MYGDLGGSITDGRIVTLRYLQRHVLPATYDLLPSRMRSLEASALLLAIGRQESAFEARRQRRGPARGFWQFESAGIAGVMTHPATRIDVAITLHVLCYPPTVAACHAGVEHNDVLAAVFARLLLWTLPGRLPGPDETDEGWRQYLATWRPGRPRKATWDGNFEAGWVASHEVTV